MYRLLVATVLGAGVLASACGTSDEEPATSSARAEPASEPGGWVEPTTAPPSDEACRAEQGYAKCSDCCFDSHPTAKALIWNTLRGCVCRNAEPSCAAECGPEYCGGTLTYDDSEANKPCLRCLERAYAGRDAVCLDRVGDVCLADVECVAAARCDDRCSAPERAPKDAGADG